MAQVLDMQAALQLRQGQAAAALATGRQAAALYGRLQDQPKLLQNQINQAIALKAMGSFAEARRLLEQIAARLQSAPDSLEKARALRLLGDTFQERGDLLEAQKLLEQSKAIAVAQKAPGEIAAADYSLALAVRADLLRMLDDVNDDQALQKRQSKTQEVLGQFKAIAKETSDPNLKVQAQLNQLELAFRQQIGALPQPQTRQLSQQQTQQQAQMRMIVEAVNEALDLLPTLAVAIDRLPLSRGSLYARINLAHHLAQLPTIAENWRKVVSRPDLQKPSQTADADRQTLLREAIALSRRLDERVPTARQEAAKLLGRAIQDAVKIGDARAEVSAKQNLGGLYFAEKNRRAEARQLIEAATLKADAIGAYEVSSQGHWQLAQIARDSGNTAQAIAACDTAITRNKAIRADLVALDRDVQYTFRDSVDPVYRGCAEIELQKGDQADLEKVRQILEDLQLAELQNYFREACVQGQAIQLDQLINAQKNATTAVIYTIALRDRLQVYLKLPSKSKLIPTSTVIPLATLNPLLTTWLQQLKDSEAARDAEKTGKQLYDLLIKPFQAQLEADRIDTLVFVNDGDLRNVPMAALFDGQKYLIERYAIAVSPGLQLFAPQPLKTRVLTATAAGLIDVPTQFGKGALPGTENELKTLKTLGFLKREPLRETAFTKAALQQQLKTQATPILHLSTHASFSSRLDDEENSFVLTGEGPINLKEMADLIRQRDRASDVPLELLVLSACQTAEGDRRANLGLSGLAIQSGARSTLATLWGVYDQESAIFTEGFYTALSQGQSRAKALQSAQIALLQKLRQDGSLNSTWAAYVLIGNWL